MNSIQRSIKILVGYLLRGLPIIGWVGVSMILYGCISKTGQNIAETITPIQVNQQPINIVDSGAVDLPLTISPQYNNFGKVAVGSESEKLAFMITNSGKVATKGCDPVTIAGENPEGFIIVEDLCQNKEIGPQRSCIFTVMAKPLQAKLYTASLNYNCRDIGGTVSTAIDAISVDGAENTPPVFTSLGQFTGTYEDTLQTITYDDLLNASVFSDVDKGQEVSFRLETIYNGKIYSGGAQAQAQNSFLRKNGVWQWLPDSNSNGTITAFGVSIWDSIDASNVLPFIITISSIDDSPKIVINNSLYASEGMSTTITNSVLKMEDPDNANSSLVYTITIPPPYGTLYNLTTPLTIGSSFTQDDIDNLKITYAHGGNAQYAQDYFKFHITDGLNSSLIEHQFNFFIIPGDDAPEMIGDQSFTYTGGNPFTFTLNGAVDEEGHEIFYDIIPPIPDGLVECIGLAGEYSRTKLDCSYLPPTQIETEDVVFSYQATGSGGTSSTTSTVTLRPQLLTYRGSYMNGQGTPAISGLASVSKIVESTDQQYLYAVGTGDDTIVTFNRNVDTGELTYLDSFQDGEVIGTTRVEGIENIADLVVSRDGNSLYAAGNANDAVTAFSRDANSGLLTFVAKYDSDLGLAGIDSVVMSNDDQYVYIGSADDERIVIYQRDRVTSALTYVSTIANSSGSQSENSLIIDDLGHSIISVDYDDDNISSYYANGSSVTHKTTYNATSSNFPALSGAIDSTITPDSRDVYIAGKDGNGITLFQKGSNDVLTANSPSTILDVTSGGTVEGLRGISSIESDRTGQYIFTLSSTDNKLLIFSRDKTSGNLTYLSTNEQGVNGFSSLNNPQSLMVSRDGRFVYYVSADDNSIGYARNDFIYPKGQIGLYQRISYESDGINLTGAQGGGMEAAGNFLYIFTADEQNSHILTFQRNLQTGLLSYIKSQQVEKFGENIIWGPDRILFAANANQSYAWVTFRRGNAIGVYSHDGLTGTLTRVQLHTSGCGTAYGLSSPSHMAYDEYTNHLWVAASGLGDGLVSLEIDPTDGTVIQCENGYNNLGPIGGLGIVRGQNFSNLYAALTDENKIYNYELDLIGGVVLPGPLQTIEDGIDSNYLKHLVGMELTPSSNYLVALSSPPSSDPDGPALVVFEREGINGMLTKIGEYPDSELSDAIDMKISPSGKNIYITAGAENNKVITYKIFPSGNLEYVGTQTFSEHFSGRMITDSSDKHLYLPADQTNSLSDFLRLNDPFIVSTIVEDDNSILALDGVQSIQASSRSDAFFTIAKDENAIGVICRDPTTGDLNTSCGELETMNINEPVKMLIAPTGKSVYVYNNNGGAGTVVSYLKSTGGNISFYAIGSACVSGTFTSLIDMKLTGDGRFLYIAGTNATDTVIQGYTNLDDSSPLGSGCNINGPTLTAIDSMDVAFDGYNLYTTDASSNRIQIYDIDPSNGSLTFNSNVDNVCLSPTFIKISPDGRHVYCGHSNIVTEEIGLKILDRDVKTGLLTDNNKNLFVRPYGAQTRLLNDIFYMDFSRDGKILYAVAGNGIDSSRNVVILDRDVVSGQLSVSQSFIPDLGGVGYEGNATVIPELQFANQVSITHDVSDKNLYIGVDRSGTTDVIIHLKK